MFNSEATVGAAVRSVQLQTLEDWELIVIDNGSSDRSALVVKEFDDARIRLVHETSCAVLATRLNQAVALSRGDFIARMDADDVCFPERLARQVERLQQDPQLDVVGCGAVVFTEGAELLGRLPGGLNHEEITSRPFHGFPFPHPTWCGRAAWFRNNPYDPDIVTAEDQDLLLRTFRTSKFGSLETVLFGYRQNQLHLRKLLPGRRAFVRSLWRYARQSGQFCSPVAGIVQHVFKGAMDIATIGLGFNHLAQQYRLGPVSSSMVRQWQDLLTRLERG
jgi:glycosyltransferase involved in cell wall biosynthesis